MYRMDLISTLLSYRRSLLYEIERCENIKYKNFEDVSTELDSYLYSLRTELRNVYFELAEIGYFPFPYE